MIRRMRENRGAPEAGSRIRSGALPVQPSWHPLQNSVAGVRTPVCAVVHGVDLCPATAAGIVDDVTILMRPVSRIYSVTDGSAKGPNLFRVEEPASS